MTSLELRDLTGGYPEHSVFEHLSLTVSKGKFVTLTGPNGSGKSTLLKFFFRELRPESGAVLIDDIDSTSLSQRELASHLGFVPQNGKIDYAFTVRETVAMGRYARHGRDPDHKIEKAMEDCDIADLAKRPVTDLSGGELQRVLLARALCQDGGILLLDEPVSHLDIGHQKKILTLLRQLAERDMSIVCVLHDLLLAQIYSDEAILLDKGSIVSYGPTEQVITKRNLEPLYKTEMHQIYDPQLQRSLWMPSWLS